MKTVIVIHGWAGYPEEGWKPWLKKELLKKGYKVLIPLMPNTKTPKLNDWLKHLKKIVGIPNEQLILIGHSLGVITILRYLEDLKNEKIKGAILISGFSYNLEYQGYNNELLNFFQKAVNFKKVKKHCKKFIILHSTHDPYVPIKHAYLLKEKLNAVVIIKKGTSHFSGDEGLTKLPTLLKLIEKI